MYHAKVSAEKMQEGFFELMRLPILPREPKKIKKEDIVVHLQELLKFFQGDYL